jgi:hypothetical protein
MSLNAATQGRAEPAAPLAVTPISRTQRRWQVLYQQLQCDHEPCFQTEKRHSCKETTCPWRTECLALRAEWRR